MYVCVCVCVCVYMCVCMCENERRTASCRYNFTLSTSFHGRVGVPHGDCIPPTLFNLFASRFTTSSATPMQMTSLFHIPTPTLLRCLKPLRPCIKYWGVGGWARFGHCRVYETRCFYFIMQCVLFLGKCKR